LPAALSVLPDDDACDRRRGCARLSKGRRFRQAARREPGDPLGRAVELRRSVPQSRAVAHLRGGARAQRHAHSRQRRQSQQCLGGCPRRPGQTPGSGGALLDRWGQRRDLSPLPRPRRFRSSPRQCAAHQRVEALPPQRPAEADLAVHRLRPQRARGCGGAPRALDEVNVATPIWCVAPPPARRRTSNAGALHSVSPARSGAACHGRA
jgi:hypothetical protein